jgi:hypothetical protein
MRAARVGGTQPPERSLGSDKASETTSVAVALPAPQSKPVAPASRLVARIALLVAFGLGL